MLVGFSILRQNPLQPFSDAARVVAGTTVKPIIQLVYLHSLLSKEPFSRVRAPPYWV